MKVKKWMVVMGVGFAIFLVLMFAPIPEGSKEMVMYLLKMIFGGGE